MKKKLDQMSLQELWKLFPIILTEYNPQWPIIYENEKQILYQLYPQLIKRINHFGSTSVVGLVSKPTIDILLEVKQEFDRDKFIKIAKQAGYLVSNQPDNPPPHLMLKRGYTEQGFQGQAFHVHVRYLGDWDELYFRDYLRLHSDAREQYVSLKKELAIKYVNDRDKYTDSKGDLIKELTIEARKEFGPIYK